MQWRGEISEETVVDSDAILVLGVVTVRRSLVWVKNLIPPEVYATYAGPTCLLKTSSERQQQPIKVSGERGNEAKLTHTHTQ